MKTKIIFIFIAAIAAIHLYASSVNIDGIKYELDNTNLTASVSDGVQCNGNVVIPSTIFYLEKTYSVTSIGYGAFNGCSSLTSVTIPNSVTSIGDVAFLSCSGLKSINVNAANTHYVSVDGVLFNYAKDTLIQYPIGNTSTSYTISNLATSIGEGAFADCSSLTSITIPNSVTSIGNDAFYYCFNLATVFNDSELDIRKGRSDYGYVAYYAKNVCNGIPKGDFVIKNDTILTGYLGNDANVTIPGYVTTIGENAFYRCSGLTSVTIPNSVTSIGSQAFYDCTNLATVYNRSKLDIRKGHSDYGYVAYYAKNVYNGIPKGDFFIKNDTILTGYLGNDANVTIPGYVTTIGENAFSGCSGLTSVTIPNSVTSIENAAFDGCSGLTKTNYTGTVADWCKINFDNDDYISNPIAKSHNFYINDVEVKDLVIPEGVESIGNYAFEGCSGLTSVTIGNSVTSIGWSAFRNCSGLTDIYCYATIPPSCKNTSNFDGVSEHCYIHVPVGTKRAYELAVGWSHFIHFFEISEITGDTTGEVGVEVTENTAVFTWPVNPTASSYTLVIKKNDEVFCTLTFNSLGQLVGMSFAPARNRNQQSSADNTTYGYSFVVSNLDASSTYDYVFTAKDKTDQVLSTKSGRFTTKESTDLPVVSSEEKAGISKFIQNGQLYILRDGKVYDVRGAKVE